MREMLGSLFGGHSDYWLTRWLFQRSLAAIYLVAFAVVVNQFRPLLGSRGLTPVPFFLSRVEFMSSPSLFYLYYSDRFAMVLGWVGVVLSVAAIAGISENFGTPVSMAAWFLLWLIYLSFVNVGQTWYSFGWESLLLETGFLAIFLGAKNVAPPVMVIWLLRWVLFRLMFGAGLIKLRGDPCWRDLTCLVYQWETQPMPNPLSWFFNRLPLWMDKAGVTFNHLAEVVAPFGYLVPWAPVRYLAGGITIVFQFILILSGNLSWLNWLTIVIAISCFDDRALGTILRVRPAEPGNLTQAHEIAVALLAFVVVILSINPARNLFSRRQLMNASFEPLHIVNTYGAFGSVSRERFEVILEGTTEDSITPATKWTEYEFKGKPGNVRRLPPFVAPYHMRLDWLMWFAGLDRSYADPWILPLVGRLLQNDPATLGIMAGNPFPDRPPTFVRAQLYRYQFTTPDERRQSGAWWKREFVDDYLPPLALDSPGLMTILEMQGWQK